tara:strand:- start:317 stop:1057 length:741 start_codon:yes stop_codon:yes gene_type:complete
LNTFKLIESIRKKQGAAIIALIDPDSIYDKILNSMIDTINSSNFDILFVGGSKISDDKFDERLYKIKMSTNLPVILFPGSSKQISKYADAILYLSLISGRNPKYLIDEHIKSAPIIKEYALETIPTGYILLDGGINSSVEIISKTKPISMNNHEYILSCALASQYLGKSLIYLETGSGAKKPPSSKLLAYLKKHIEIPIVVGGGIKSRDTVKKLLDTGADYIVLGSILEDLTESKKIKQITNLVHH